MERITEGTEEEPGIEMDEVDEGIELIEPPYYDSLLNVKATHLLTDHAHVLALLPNPTDPVQVNAFFWSNYF